LQIAVGDLTDDGLNDVALATGGGGINLYRQVSGTIVGPEIIPGTSGGQVELSGAIRAGQLTMSGPRMLQRGFGHWFTWSAFAPASRSAQERRTAASRLAGPHRVQIAEALRGKAPSAG
jgi:hypothetical protein